MSADQRPFASDMADIRRHGATLWPALSGHRLFLSGGTGFFGRWLLETFDFLNHQHRLALDVTVLSRNPEAFLERAPHLRESGQLHFITGDVTSFAYPSGKFDFVIHAATEASAKLNAENPLAMLDTIVTGTRHMLNFAAQAGAKKFLLTSSGAVYGPQPPALLHIPENFAGSPAATDPKSAYGEGKRLAELLCSIFHKQHGLETTIARCFAFAGPYLPLDAHFAFGNFLGNALRGEDITVQGDGTPCRSYLYPTDLVIWLLTILLKGQPMQPYHVGDEAAISIRELAQSIAQLPTKPVPVHILGTPKEEELPERYVPSTVFTREQLHLRVTVPLAETLQRTWQFHAGAQ